YPELAGLKPTIHLVDAGPALLGPMSATAQKEAQEVLEKLGVDITLNTAVKDYVDDTVILANGAEIKTKTLIWTSGVIARELPGLPTENFGRGSRVLVDQFNAVQGYDNILLLGTPVFRIPIPNPPTVIPNLHR